jgi:gas vesicle protein
VTNRETWAATMIGGAIGAVVAYLFFTDKGRALRRQVEPALEEFVRELNGFRASVQRTAGVAAESWNVFNDLLGNAASKPTRPYPGGQTAPF